jgi:choline-sulfatase
VDGGVNGMAEAGNILFLMADQLSPHALPFYGHPIVKAPHLQSIAARGTVFDSAYSNSPLCVPSRMALMTGQFSSRVGVYDSGSELPSSIPTLGHYLCLSGYETCLAGKCHFVGPDQRHGFEHRLNTDVEPADFTMTADWTRPDDILDWYHTLKNVTAAGIAERSTHQEYDEESAYKATRFLYDWARKPERPFFLYLSFAHPHDPYVTPQRYWDLYDHDSIDLPDVGPIPVDERDFFGQWLYRHYDRSEFALTDEHVRTARHAYYGSISYMDDLIGGILDTLQRIRALDRTTIVFCADHGDMLGERGLWYKMAPYERATRVPLIIAPAGARGARRVTENVSLVDMMPTLLGLAGDVPEARPVEPIDGLSLLPLMVGDAPDWPDEAACELFFEGLAEPALMLRQGRYKYVRCTRQVELLFDMVADPDELRDLSADPEHIPVLEELRGRVAKRWDFDRLTQDIILSQQRRRLILRSMAAQGGYSWDYQPFEDASQLYYHDGSDWHAHDERTMLRFGEPT